MTEFDMPAVELGPLCPVALHAHGKTETTDMLARPGRTAKHGGLSIHVIQARSGFGFRLMLADKSGNGVSVEMPLTTDAIVLPDGHVVA